MKKFVIVSILAAVLFTACISQEWTVEDWKEHLFLMNPTLSQEASTMMPGFSNISKLPLGTHFAYEMEMQGTYLGTEIPMTMTMDITFSGKETIDGSDCFIIDLLMTMELSLFEETLSMEIEGTEWIEEVSGAPLKAEMTMKANMEGLEIPLPAEFIIERVGEAEYHGHDCLIFETKQDMQVMGIDLGEMKITQYMDKQTLAVVRQITTIGGQEEDSEYIEPPFSGELIWELGHKESIYTDLGTYECQVILLTQEGKEVGKMWVSKEFKTPLKYMFSVEKEGMEFTMTMTLTSYEMG
ncbi:MAG: hypothetical protein HXS53_04885 [Theionarchaea archaeon]|nr:hypothetical protein [Theionarchaea archaeon]